MLQLSFCYPVSVPSMRGWPASICSGGGFKYITLTRLCLPPYSDLEFAKSKKKVQCISGALVCPCTEAVAGCNSFSYHTMMHTVDLPHTQGCVGGYHQYIPYSGILVSITVACHPLPHATQLKEVGSSRICVSHLPQPISLELLISHHLQ